MMLPPTEVERQSIIVALLGDQFGEHANTANLEAYFRHYHAAVCPAAAGDAAIAIDTPLLKCHADLLGFISVLVGNPRVSYNGFLAEIAEPRQATVKEAEHVAKITVEVVFAVNCVLGRYYSQNVRDRGLGRVQWEGDVTFLDFMKDAFTPTSITTPEQQSKNAATIKHKNALKAWKLRKRYGIKLRATNNLLEHLSYEPSARVLKVFHNVTYLRVHLEKSKGKPLNAPFEETLHE